MQRTLRVATIFVLLVAGWVAGSFAKDLVGRAAGGFLLQIDKQTGTVTRIRSTGTNGNSLAADSQGQLYLVDDLAGGVRNLMRFDPATGTTSFALALPGFIDVRGMAFDPDDLLFMILHEDDDNSDHLARVNITTGQFATIGPMGTFSLQALAFGPEELFALKSRGEIFRVDKNSGLAILVGGGDSFEYSQGLAFDAGELFAVRRSLARIDPVTGNALVVTELSCDPPLSASCDFRGLTAVTLPDVQLCGGTTGSVCSAGQFCNIPEGCDSGVTGVCVATPASCPSDEAPVCGCDGEDYLNECMANMAGTTVDHVGTCGGLCGGAFGIPCPAGEFCQLPRQSCCCDYLGTCVPIVFDCPDHCQPVCGCDGVTYKTECHAVREGVATYRPGRCNEVQGIRFVTANNLEWPAMPGATGYNVYVDGEALSSESASPACYAAGLPVGAATIPGLPATGELWQIEVTAMFPEGEGPRGLGSLCRARRAGQSCGN